MQVTINGRLVVQVKNIVRPVSKIVKVSEVQMADKYQYKKAILKKILSRFSFRNYWRLLPYSYLRSRKDITKSRFFETRFSLYEYLFQSKKNKKITLFEFGTFRGESLRRFTELNTNPESVFYSFDTFTGLPCDWHTTKKGHFDVQSQLPEIEDSRIFYFVGLFRDTIFDFIKSTNVDSKGGEIFIHVDSDLFSSAATVLPSLIGYYKLEEFTLIYDEFAGDEAVMHYFLEQIFDQHKFVPVGHTTQKYGYAFATAFAVSKD